MAAQFEYVPNTTDFQSTAEPLIIQVSEAVAGPYFKYRFVLRIKDRTSTTTFATLKTHPLSTTNLSAIFDISRVLDDYIGPNVVNGNSTDGNILTLGRTGFDPANLVGESVDQFVARKFELELSHESATSATADPTESAVEDTTALFAFRDEFINSGQAYARGDGQYQPSIATNNFLSVAPNLGSNASVDVGGFGQAREHRIGIDQPYVLAWGAQPGGSLPNGTDTSPQYCTVRGYEADGTVIGTKNIEMNTVGGNNAPTTDAAAVQFIGIGPANLEEHATAASDTTLLNIIQDANLAYYEVHLSTSASYSIVFQDTVIHRFTIDNGCSKYTRVQLLFLNRHGGWDAFNFDQRSEERLSNIERSQYNRPRGNWDTVTGLIDFTYDGWERGVTTTTVKAERQITVASDYVEEGYSDMLRDIATSRSVYIVDGTNLIPVVVTDSEFLFKTSVNEKLISYSFTLRYSNRPRLK